VKPSLFHSARDGQQAGAIREPSRRVPKLSLDRTFPLLLRFTHKLGPSVEERARISERYPDPDPAKRKVESRCAAPDTSAVFVSE
jgi:hypothetical protein